MTRNELLECICPTAETYSCNIDNMGSCTYCKGLMNRFLDEYDKQIKIEVIDEVQHIINKYSEYARPVGWSKKTEIICTSILREELEKI